MSGGSFDYLYLDLEDTEKILDTPQRLREMEEYLRERKKHEIADEILRFRLDVETHVRRLMIMGRRLRHVVHAVEWWASSDWGEDQVDSVWHRFLWGNDEQ